MVMLFVMLYMTVLGMSMVLLFVERRVSRRQTTVVFCGSLVLVLALVIGVYCRLGIETLVYLYSLVAHVPALLLCLYLSRHRGWRLLFQLLSSILFCALIQHAAGLVYYLSGNRFWVLAAAYALLTPLVLWFLLRVLRPLFRQVLLELQHGWWLMCLVMAGYYTIVIYLIPGYVGSELTSTILKPAISLLMVGFYAILLFFFSRIRKEAEARNNAQLAALQLSALQSRMEAVKAAEDMIRAERHDLRHRIQAVMEMVARGEEKSALDFLEATQRRLDEHKLIRWCRPPVLNAVFSSYFDQAQNQDIPVEADISLPDALPVDEGELAIVLANALENAIHANLLLPTEQRKIRCRMVGTPGVMLELSNPCADDVVFDSNGLPIAQRKGHGLGVQSISAFCHKNGAVCQFDLTDGWFRLRLIL